MESELAGGELGPRYLPEAIESGTDRRSTHGSKGNTELVLLLCDGACCLMLLLRFCEEVPESVNDRLAVVFYFL